MPVRIGELLLKEKRITPAQLQEALTYQKTNGGKLGFNLVKLGYVKDEEITGLLSKQYGVPSINLTQFDIDPSVVKLVPGDTAQKYQIVPLSRAVDFRLWLRTLKGSRLRRRWSSSRCRLLLGR